MHLGRPSGRRSKQIVIGILVLLAFLLLVSFRREFQLLLTPFPPKLGVEEGIKTPQAILSKGNFFWLVCSGSFFMVFVMWVWLVAFQSLLPITNFFVDPLRCMKEVYRSTWHLMLYLLRIHGPAIFVKDGAQNATKEDEKRENWPGVVVVDFNSAVVLEERNPPPGMNGAIISIIMAFLEALKLCDPKESPRVRGAGITFTRPRERIRGAVDLRKQFRIQPQVRCYTREGIELYSNMLTGFTIGQDPDVLQVMYVEDFRPEFLHVVTMKDEKDGGLLVTGISAVYEELDQQDRKEIHKYAVENGYPQNIAFMEPYSPVPRPAMQVQYNPERVFNAVFAQARDENQGAIEWADLPTRVAAGFFREILSHINYDDLYDVKQEKEKFPLPQHKAKLKFAMRNSGILAFRLILDRNGKPLVKGRIYHPEDLLVSPILTLNNPKVLRDRGIKILFASFSDPIPVNDEIYQHRLDTWRANWEREFNISLASSDLHAMRERSRARIEAQQDLWLSLSRLFEQRNCTDEALALRILQALETAAADPKTHALLPSETIFMLNYVHTILLQPGGVSTFLLPGRGDT